MTPGEFVTAFVALFTLMNPIGGIPIVLSLTAAYTPAERNRTLLLAGISIAVILLVSLFLGAKLLEILNIRIEAFRLAGSVVIVSMAFSMLHAQVSGQRATESEHEEAESRTSIGVMPIATPLLAGPGTISVVVVYASRIFGLLLLAIGLGTAADALTALLPGLAR